MSDGRKNIVILGAGSGGISVWNELKLAKLDESKFNVILVNPSPYFPHRISAIRATVTTDGNFDEDSWFLLGEKFNQGNSKLVVGSVVSISDNEDGSGSVTLDNGEVIAYAYLVLATGSAWDSHLAFPGDQSGSKAWSATWRAKFEKAESILLVGGGVIGVETAGEIKEYFPHKKVTIVHGSEQLLNSAYPLWWRQRLTSRVRALDVDLILGDYVDQTELSSDGTVSTRQGRKIDTDLLVNTRGPKPITSFVGSSLGEDTLTKGGLVKVTPTLQLESHATVFAVGDIVEWKEQKQASKTYAHAAIAAKNIVALTLGQQAQTLYKGSSEMVLVTLGKTRGYGYVSYFGGFSLPSWLCAMLKSKTLLVKMIKGNLKL